MGTIKNFIEKIKSARYGKDVRQSIVDAIEQTYSDAISNGHTDMEVAKARDTYNDLNSRLEADKNQMEEKIENEEANRKEALENMQKQVNGLASGSPKGTFETKSALETANPETGVYIISKDGHIYSWNKNGNSAIDLGVYQATAVAYNSIENKMLKNKAITPNKTTFIESNEIEATVNLYESTADTVKLAPDATGTGLLVGGVTSISFVIPIQHNKTVTIEKVSSARFNVITTKEYPAIGVAYNQYLRKGEETKATIQASEEDNYLFVTYYLPSQDTELTKEEIEDSIKVYYGEQWTESSEATEIKIPLLRCSISNINSNLVKALSYRQLGQLKRGYIALSCDDGNNALATYTIPKLKELKQKYNRNIPVTFGLMTDSPIFRKQ